jgi:hypothetical protein
MGTLPVIVGLDYSDRSVQVCVLNEQGQVLGNRGCANDWQVIKEFERGKHAPKVDLHYRINVSLCQTTGPS